MTAAFCIQKLLQCTFSSPSVCLYAYKLDNNDIGYARIVREYSVTEQEINNLDSVLKGVCAEASDGCDEGRQKETILKYKEDYRAHVI